MANRRFKWLRRVLILAIVLAAGPLLTVACGSVELGKDWRTADRASTGIEPDPRTTQESVVQVYAARAFNWRGIFAVHTWIATKPANAASFTVHQVVGWRKYRGLPVVVSHADIPDRKWFDAPAELLFELRGGEAQAVIPEIEDAVARYPYPREYAVWPGPNSNTFTAFVAREVPALRFSMPSTAVGKDYLGKTTFFSRAPSTTGFQASVVGLLGVTVALQEGLEINVLGFCFGVSPLEMAIKLPGIGALGLRSSH